MRGAGFLQWPVLPSRDLKRLTVDPPKSPESDSSLLCEVGEEKMTHRIRVLKPAFFTEFQTGDDSLRSSYVQTTLLP
jgi:hypothetical protein